MLFLIFVIHILLSESTEIPDPISLNPSVTPDGDQLWDGDMILSQEQVEFFYGDPRLRKATSIKPMLWPDGLVPFRLEPNAQRDRKVILEAIRRWETLTCLKFEELESPTKDPHIYFKKSSGCYSQVGRAYWREGQEVSLGYGCEDAGLIMHEIGHAIGFHHEHSRPDRDKNIKVQLQNVKQDHKRNFKKETYVNNYDVPYDVGSIMHYGPTTFSANGNKTLVPLDPTTEFIMGQRDGLSFNDLKLANLMYNCTSRCSRPPPCENGGFVNKECSCICPPEYKGKSCSEKDPKALGCIHRVNAETVITSPNYPKTYPSDLKCVWWVQAPEGKRVQVKFEDYELRRREDDNTCYWDTTEVRTENRFDGIKYCGEDLKGKTLVSNTEDFVLFFTTKMMSNKGFRATVKFI